jgi:hypothetical protein
MPNSGRYTKWTQSHPIPNFKKKLTPSRSMFNVMAAEHKEYEIGLYFIREHVRLCAWAPAYKQHIRTYIKYVFLVLL